MVETIVLIRSNSLSYDPRVKKLARSISQRYNLLLLGWDRDLQHSRHEIKNSVEILRFPLRAPYGRASLILLYPIFWMWVFLILVSRRPEIIHACDFEALIPAVLFRYLFSTQLVFDSFDRFAMAFIPPSHYILYNLVNELEDLSASKADCVITVSKQRLESFRYKQRCSTVIMNCSDNHPEAFQLASTTQMSLQGDLTVVYAGAIAQDRGLVELANAIDKLQDVKFIIAGRIIHPGTYGALRKAQSVQYVGLLSNEEALMLQAKASVIPLLYNPSQPINKVASPNKLFDAMMLGIPVITNVCKDIIEETSCGVVVELDEEHITQSLKGLMESPELLRSLGQNGRAAFVQKYNWGMMEGKLFQVYQNLLSK